MKIRTSGITICGIIFALSFVCALSSCSGGGADSKKTADKMTVIAEPEFEMITSHGTMKIRLYAQTPQHRDNFVKLVNEKYYDGVRFHRIIEGFMIQGGDPYSKDIAMIDSWGAGGPGYTVPAEFVKDYRHKKGAIAAARKGDMANPRKASSGSQFYIVHDESGCSHLDGDYTVFGEVFEGLEVVDRIASVQTDYKCRPYEDVIIVSVRPLGVSDDHADIDTTSADMSQTDSTLAE